MGKKRVTISKEPLAPTTVGQINTHKFGWILTLIIIILFGGVVYYLPTLSKVYVNGQFDINPILDILEQWRLYTRPKSTIVNETNITNETNHTNETIDDIKYEKLYFNKSNEVTILNIKFSSIKYEEIDDVLFNEETNEEYTQKRYQMSFNIENLSDEIVNLEQMQFLLEVFNDDNIINSFYVTQEIEANKSTEVSIDLDGPVNMFKFSIIDDSNDYLLCQTDNRSITYIFDKDGLISVEDNNNIYMDNELYDDYYEKYNNILNNNTNKDISITLTDIENGFNYVYVVKYSNEFTKDSSAVYFEKGKSKDYVKTYMEKKTYSCK